MENSVAQPILKQVEGILQDFVGTLNVFVGLQAMKETYIIHLRSCHYALYIYTSLSAVGLFSTLRITDDLSIVGHLSTGKPVTIERVKAAR